MNEVISYAKNQNLGFTIPYTFNGEEKNYLPDFIVKIRTTPSPSSPPVKGGDFRFPSREGIRGVCPSPLAGEGKGEGASENILNLIIEVTGEKKKDKEAKVATARDPCIPAVSNHGVFGKWVFLEIRDPWNAKTEIREFLEFIMVK